jgi:hypothetical protein
VCVCVWITAPYLPPDPVHPLRHELYQLYDEGPQHRATMFRSIDRLKLTLSILESETQFGGCAFEFNAMLANTHHPLSAYFPLHITHKRQELHTLWHSYWSPFYQPIEQIQEYYGEKVAFYFAWCVSPNHHFC